MRQQRRVERNRRWLHFRVLADRVRRDVRDLPVHPAGAVWSSLSDVGQVLVGRTATADAPALSATVSFPGEPIPGMYADDNPDVTERMTVTSGTASWTMNIGGSTANSGAFTMVLTRVAATKASGDNQIYAVSGTLDATLPPVAGTSASGDLTLQARF